MQQAIGNDDNSTCSSLAQTPNNLRFQSQLQLVQRVQQISFDQLAQKPLKNNGLGPQYRKMILNMKMKKSKQTCTICLQSFVESEIIKKLPCKHILHRNCAKSWLKCSIYCPVCRFNLQNYFSNLDPKHSELPKPDAYMAKQKKQDKDKTLTQKIHLCT